MSAFLPRNSVVFAALAVATTLAASNRPAIAQDIPLPSFLDRDSLFGSDSDKPGAYASPSASDLVPDSADVGAAPMSRLQRFEPIALPTRPGMAPAPQAPQIELPGLPDYAPGGPNGPGRTVMSFDAHLTADGAAVPNGLVWRLYSAVPARDGKLVLVASSASSSPRFSMANGAYILHVAFGRAGVAERIVFDGGNEHRTIDLEAGGLKLDALVGDGHKIDPKRLTFDVYTEGDDETDRDLVARNVAPGKVLRLNAGTYHVVSRYGAVNASVRADIHVEAGKITQATLKHRAALLTMKLVREHGGEAIADTAWSITTTSGDLVRESVGAFPSMVLASGDYVVVARNRDKVFQRSFTVKAGQNADVEVLTSDLAPEHSAGAFEGSGD